MTQLDLEPEAEPAANKRRIHLREISGDSDMPLETVGQDLRAARLRKGDDLAAVSKSLKIRKDHLEAIEEDNLAGLPGKTYAVGFVRSYAAYLGLDAVQTVDRFKAEINGRAEEGAPPVTVIDEDEHRRLPQGWRVIAGVVVLAVIYGGYHLLTADRAANTPVPSPPAQYMPHPVASAAPRPTPVQQAVVSPAITTVPTAISPASPDANPSTNIAVAPPAAAVPTAQPTAQPAPENGHVYGEQNRNPRVILRARGDTRIVVRGPGGMIYINHLLKSGDVYQLPNIVGLTLTTTNAGAVEIDLDGLSMGVAGHDLQTMGDLSLDPQAIEDRLNGHSG